jgi:galactose mutarotase-like enzyme
MSVRFDAHWRYRGLQALVLENDQVRIVILPELGAKIWSILYKPLDQEVLWHHPRVHPRLAPFGATYDDWFCGGWDELFPNDAPVAVGGEQYPDHGELWSMPFEWELAAQSPHEVTVRFHRQGVVTVTNIEKVITLRAGEPLLHLHYRVENIGAFPLDFLWKLHPALRITEQSRIDLPARRMVVDDGFRVRTGGVGEFTWPTVQTPQGAVDMREVPPQSSLRTDFYYAVELDDGWCAVSNAAGGTGFGLVFDREVLPTVWVFGAYGGWRGIYTTIIEPCSGYP